MRCRLSLWLLAVLAVTALLAVGTVATSLTAATEIDSTTQTSFDDQLDTHQHSTPPPLSFASPSSATPAAETHRHVPSLQEERKEWKAPAMSADHSNTKNGKGSHKSETTQSNNVPLQCSVWFSLMSSEPPISSTAAGKSNGNDAATAPSVRAGKCWLATSRLDALRNDPWTIFRTAAAAAAASTATPSVKDSEIATVWQLGPHTLATQSLLQSTVHAYFLNLSRTLPLMRSETERTEEGSAPLHESRAARHLAYRLEAYNELYASHGSSPHLRTAPLKVERAAQWSHRANSIEDESDGDISRCFAQAQATLASVLQPCWHALVALLHRVGATTRVWRFGVEAYANACARAWWSGVSWKSLLYHRHLVLRFPVGRWEGLETDRDGSGRFCTTTGEKGEATCTTVDAEVSSRMEMATRGALSMLRLISFPPVAQASAQTVRYTCSLAAVASASQVLQEDRMLHQQQNQQPKIRRQATGLAEEGWTYTSVKRSSGSAGAASSSSRGTFVSYVLNLSLRLVKRLFVHDDGNSLESRSGESAFSNPANANAARLRASHASSVATPPAVYAARAFLQRVREELGPFQTSAASSLPIALQRLVGHRVMGTHMELMEIAGEDMDHHGGVDRIDFVVKWSATLPAGTPMCLALMALPEDGLLLHVEETLVFDYLWLLLVCAAYVVLQLERRVAQSALARHLLTGLTGTLLLVLLAMFYLLREVQRMSVGKLALVTALVLGGSTAALEGLWSVFWTYSNLDSLWWSTSMTGSGSGRPHRAGGDALDRDSEDSGDVFSGPMKLLLVVVVVVVMACAVSSVLLNWLIPVAYLRTATRWSVRILLVLLWWLCLRQNCEATLLTLLVYALVFKARWWLAGCLPRSRRRGVAQHQQTFVQQSKRAHLWSIEDPKDNLPDAARQARAYVRPLAATPHRDHHSDYSNLSTTEGRMRKFDEDGALHTRQALEQLAAHLRANPTAYATRLRDPNGVLRWAGENDGDVEESGGSDGD